MDAIGLRELRQDASAFVRRAEAGEEIVITVSGREAARLVPSHPTPWRTWDDISDLFRGTSDPDWADDRELIDGSLHDPWADQ